MTGCAKHRPYLAAIADGELGPVPPAAVEHVAGCRDCAHDVELQRALAGRLRLALETPAVRPAAPARSRQRAAVAFAVVAALVLAASGVVAVELMRPDPVLAAAAASGRPAQFRSAESGQIEAWCSRESGHEMGGMDLSPLQAVGARVDRTAGSAIVTIYYLSAEGLPVAVSWLDATAAPPGGRAVTSRVVGGRLTLVARSPHGTAVISGAAPAAVLWNAAARVEDGA